MTLGKLPREIISLITFERKVLKITVSLTTEERNNFKNNATANYKRSIEELEDQIRTLFTTNKKLKVKIIGHR